MDINRELENQRNERQLNILKGFKEYDDVLVKAKYKDNAENRKLGRVGSEYGGSVDRNSKSWKQTKKPKKYTQDFLDEDTGEVVSIDRKEKDVDNAVSPSKTMKKLDKKLNDKLGDADDHVRKIRDKITDVDAMIDDQKDAKMRLEVDMETEAGEYQNAGKVWTDDDANRYGKDLNEIDDTIESLGKEKKELKSLLVDANSKFDKVFNKNQKIKADKKNKKKS